MLIKMEKEITLAALSGMITGSNKYVEKNLFFKHKPQKIIFSSAESCFTFNAEIYASVTGRPFFHLLFDYTC